MPAPLSNDAEITETVVNCVFQRYYRTSISKGFDGKLETSIFGCRIRLTPVNWRIVRSDDIFQILNSMLNIRDKWFRLRSATMLVHSFFRDRTLIHLKICHKMRWILNGTKLVKIDGWIRTLCAMATTDSAVRWETEWKKKPNDEQKRMLERTALLLPNRFQRHVIIIIIIFYEMYEYYLRLVHI